MKQRFTTAAFVALFGLAGLATIPSAVGASNPRSQVVEVAVYVIKPTHAKSFKALHAEIVGALRKVDGFVSATTSRDLKQPTLVIDRVVWRDKAAFERASKTLPASLSKRFSEALAEMKYWGLSR